MINAYTDPALVQTQVEHPVRNDLAQLLVNKVVDHHFFRLALGLPLPATVLERADEFLFLGIHRDHRLAALLKALDRGVDILELRIAVRMRSAFLGLAVALQAITGLLEHRPYRPGAYRMAVAGERLGQIHRALAGPAQRRHRIAPRARFDQSIQRLRQPRIRFAQPLAPAALLAKPRRHRRSWMFLARRQLDESLANGIARHPRRAAQRAHATSPVGLRFARRPLPAHALIHQRRECSIAGFDLAKRSGILHTLIKGQQPELIKLFSRNT